MAERPAQPRLSPELALTTVSWIAALALLALNDHVLKQAGTLPAWLTGKLSDFAGLYVAPALLATVLRARSQRALLACHIAVGAVFAAINLDPRCAASCVRALSTFGIDWRIVTDAEDLIALPMLLASQRWLGAAMAKGDAIGQLKRRAQQALALAGLACCVATSDDDSGDDFIGSTGPHLHNPTDQRLDVLVRELRESVLIDCDTVAADPGRLLPDSAFAPAVAYELGPRENLATNSPLVGSKGLVDFDVFDRSFDGQPACTALIVSAAKLSPVLLFWQNNDDIDHNVAFTYENEKEWQPGAVVLQPGRAGVAGYRSVGPKLVFAIARGPSDVSESCRLPDPAQRPAVSSDFPVGRRQVLSADEGADGCVALRFGPLLPTPARPPINSDEDDVDAGAGDEGDAGAEPEPEPEADPSEPAEPLPDASGEPATYLCVPPGMFPFERGDLVAIDRAAGGLHMAVHDDEALPLRELFVTPLERVTYAAELEIHVTPLDSCEYQQRSGCAETAVPAEATVRRATPLTLRSGDAPQHVTDGEREIDLALAFGQWRAVLDSVCAEGAIATGSDGVVVAVVRSEGK
jgi:hypothetical protein